jgi:hypothetical protein
MEKVNEVNVETLKLKIFTGWKVKGVKSKLVVSKS